MEFPDNLLEIISDDNHYEIYKFIHQTNYVDMSALNNYTIYNYISKLSNNLNFKITFQIYDTYGKPE